MKAVRIHEYGGPEKLLFEDNVPDPVVQPDSVLIKTVAASINPIDWKVRSGARQKDFPLALPAILGRDVSGVVLEVGSDVRNVKPGERVVAFSNATYAELVAVAGSLVTHLPDGADPTHAAAIPLIALTGDQLVRQAAGVKAGQTVVITGALGSVGRAAVHSAKKLGAHVIAGVRTSQLVEARSLGVADLVAIDDDAAIAKLSVDAVADTVGGAVAANLLARVKAGGRFGYASVLPEGKAAMYPKVKVTRVLAQPDPSKVREFLDDLRDEKFLLPIGRKLPLRDAAEGHRLGEKGGVGKIILIV
jgi:NADPH:quinone reductase-like Zn-dependent oxidoreductase